MGNSKHTVLMIAVCIGLFSFLSSIIISKYGSESLVMGVGLFSIALIAVSLMLLWKSMAEGGMAPKDGAARGVGVPPREGEAQEEYPAKAEPFEEPAVNQQEK